LGYDGVGAFSWGGGGGDGCGVGGRGGAATTFPVHLW